MNTSSSSAWKLFQLSGRSCWQIFFMHALLVVDSRYLIGGSVLYYPQLASISSYQLYVEVSLWKSPTLKFFFSEVCFLLMYSILILQVVCEELEWLPFYRSNTADTKQTDDTKGQQEGIPRGEAISLVLDVCSYWMTSFIKYSVWLENPSNIKAARFLSRG